jgi:hypothetical protein
MNCQHPSHFVSSVSLLRNFNLDSSRHITAIPKTGRGVLYGCEMLRIPHCLDSRLTVGGKVISLPLLPRIIIFLLLVFIYVRSLVSPKAWWAGRIR